MESYSCSNPRAHLSLAATLNFHYSRFFVIQNDPNAIWSADFPLKVQFLNENELDQFGWCYNKKKITADFTDDIIKWSNRWYNKPSKSKDKIFKKVSKDGHIRVWFHKDKPSECKLGAYATQVRSSEPTMWLNLSSDFASGNANKQHTVIHEFGHALGVLHEHERPDMWDSIDPFLDMKKIKAYHGDHNMCDGINMAGDPMDNTTPGHYFAPMTDYDRQSIMHYPWASMGFLKEGYQTVKDVEESRKLKGRLTHNGKLVTDKQYETLIEVIEAFRDESKVITEPSKLDKSGLQKAYSQLRCEMDVLFCLESGDLLFDHDELSGDKRVYVCGSFNDWKEKIEMLPNALGQRTATVNLRLGKHQYKFLVESKWCYHSDMPIVPNDRGTYNNEVNVTQKHIDAHIDEQTLTDYECPPKSVIWF